MTIQVNVHTGSGRKLEVESRIYSDEKSNFVAVALKIGSEEVKVFLHELADIDRLAFEFGNLSREMRDVYGWTEKKEETK